MEDNKNTEKILSQLKEDITPTRLNICIPKAYDKLLDKWKCICSCEEHNVSYLTTSDLNSGHSKSCGCYNREIARKRFKDFTGQRFGKLVVIEATN